MGGVRSLTRPPRLVALLVLAAAIAVAVWLATGSGHDRAATTLSASACPSWAAPAEHESGEEAESEGEAEGEREREGEEHEGPRCLPHPEVESPDDLMKAGGTIAARSSAPLTRPPRGATARAYRQTQRLRASQPSVPGSGGTWTPLGDQPLVADNHDFDQQSTPILGGSSTDEGLVKLAGRVSDLAYDSEHERVLASVANGGVWASDDLGGSWHSIGDGLPTQVVGSVGWSPAQGGTIIALTGDNAFGAYTYAGLGAYRSTDGGKHWHRAKGVPAGALGFKVAVDPANPDVVYLATGMGLYRSTDDGASFANVDLPTGACHGDSTRKGCFFANVVTDVVVQGPDEFGHEGGAVLAAVGWRAGDKRNDDGSVQAPANGIYVSADGSPGSFRRTPIDDNGFAPRHRVGRVELGIAAGPAQDHDYVYAIVQDAVLFDKGTLLGLDVPEIDDPILGSDLTATPTYLNGIYVSPDFGRTWRKMEGGLRLQSPLTGSALSPVFQVAARYGPGIQAWYNEWIGPDPTRQTADGVPTRVTFGLEEVWQNRRTTAPADGLTGFQVIGRYFGGTTCQALLTLPVCPTNHPITPSTTTHPDHHAGLYVPDGEGGVYLFDGGDGGISRQHVAAGEEMDNTKWGAGYVDGMHTLLPYYAAMAKDGTVWAGLQDNGMLKIEPDGRQFMTFGGDGFFAATDPGNSDVAYGETAGGAMYVTKDGGKTWNLGIDPFLDNGGFVTPFVMDPGDPNHLLVAGRNVEETVYGPDTTSPGSGEEKQWAQVYDLGTRRHPGDAGAEADPDGKDPSNQATATALQGDAAYVGFCGFCDPLTEGLPFHSGLATNVGGSAPAQRMTGDGWHIAAARGLPQRYITAIAIDPQDPRTVYVTLGGYQLRPYAPPGAVGGDTSEIGAGHVFRSTDAGETFTDVSGDLPDTPATWVLLHGDQLVVATDNGVFVSKGTDGGRWAPAGSDLPNVPVFSLSESPRSADEIVAATYGRGVYTYKFADAPRASGGRASHRRPRVAIRHLRASRRHGIHVRGIARGRGHGVRRVDVALARRVGHGRCRFLRRGGRFTRPRACSKPRYLVAHGRRTWSLRVRRHLRRGAYRVTARAVGRDGRHSRPRSRRFHIR